MSLVSVPVVVTVAVLVRVGWLVDNGRLGGAGCKPFQLGTFERVTAGSRPKTSVGADFPFSAWDPRSVSPGGRDARASTRLLSEKDCVAGGFGELFDAGRNIDGVADQSELELACRHRSCRRLPHRY